MNRKEVELLAQRACDALEREGLLLLDGGYRDPILCLDMAKSTIFLALAKMLLKKEGTI